MTQSQHAQMRRWEGMGEEQVRVKIAALTALFGVYVLFQRVIIFISVWLYELLFVMRKR